MLKCVIVKCGGQHKRGVEPGGWHWYGIKCSKSSESCTENHESSLIINVTVVSGSGVKELGKVIGGTRPHTQGTFHNWDYYNI